MIKIREYFDTYYVANNMAMFLAGDLNPSEDIKLIDQYFGKLRTGEVPSLKPAVAGPINGPKEIEIYGPSQESVQIGFRFGPVNSNDDRMVDLIDLLLNNSQAGIIDLDLVQSQKILRGGSSSDFQNEYGSHVLRGTPREGQSLTEVKDLLLGSIEKIKKGEFGDWLIPAVINDMELSEIEGAASNNVAYRYLQSFIYNTPWSESLGRIDKIAKITKEEVMAFATEHYTDDHVVIYKRIGLDTNVAKVSNPKITPLPINREDESEFMQEFKSMTASRLDPVFIDYNTSISRANLASGIEVNYIKNTTNELFNLIYIIDMGREHNKKLSLAVQYLPYLGTDKYSPSQLQEEFYKLGLRMSVLASSNRSFVSIEGLEKSLDKGVELLEHVLSNVKADQTVYNDYIEGILKKRADGKLSKGRIMHGAMRSYAVYGPNSPYRDILSEEELSAQDPNELAELVKGIFDFDHYLFYYGEKELDEVTALLNTHHVVSEKLLEYPEIKTYNPLETNKNLVYFVNYDMVQTEIMLVARDDQFTEELMPYARLYGSYFGSGLSSIIFQEIREAKGLAYSASSSFSTPSLPDRYHYMTAYIGTQVNKLPEAVPALMGIINDMPEAEKMFEASKLSITKKIETERVTKTSIFWSFLANKRRGIDHDSRKDIYEKVQNITMADLKQFIEEHVKKEHYVYLVIGNRDDIDLPYLKSLGEFKELTLEEIFGY
ncbi:MAG: insulinase family protein [Flavobacteriales bacterium]|nr:insulinase family protein [Flavobacteriales bacterium]